jgi:F-type H+-transporting ATPase subunit b
MTGMRRTPALIAAGLLLASPAHAAKGPFVSLANTDFVVLISFILFLGLLAYFKVPGLLTKMLDERADGIRKDLDEARALREEAQTLLASYERKQKDVQVQAERIVEAARADAAATAEQAKRELESTITRRLAAADEQLASSEASAVKAVRDQAITIAIAAASEVMAKQMDATKAGTLIDDGIREVRAKLH